MFSTSRAKIGKFALHPLTDLGSLKFGIPLYPLHPQGSPLPQNFGTWGAQGTHENMMLMLLVEL